MKEEIWATGTEGGAGLYDVSNHGAVRRALRYGLFRYLNPSLNTKGYRHIHLLVEGKPKCFKVARLVAAAFVANPEGKPQVNHKNGKKTDDRASNLEWVDNRENQLHAIAIGLETAARGEKKRGAKLTEAAVISIRALREAGESRDSLAKRLVSPSTLSRLF